MVSLHLKAMAREGGKRPIYRPPAWYLSGNEAYELKAFRGPGGADIFKLKMRSRIFGCEHLR